MDNKFTAKKIILKIILIFAFILIHDLINPIPGSELFFSFAKIDGKPAIGNMREKQCQKGNIRLLISTADLYTIDTGVILDGELDIEQLRGYLGKKFQLAHPSCKYMITAPKPFLVTCESHKNSNSKDDLSNSDQLKCNEISKSLTEEIAKYVKNNGKLPNTKLDINFLKKEGLLKAEFTANPKCNYMINSPEYNLTCKYHGPGYSSPNYDFDKKYRSEEDFNKDYTEELIKCKAPGVISLVVATLIILFAF